LALLLHYRLVFAFFLFLLPAALAAAFFPAGV